ncbi:MAG: hypothetical protein CM1200mP14_08110 [Gammaproteobacteria bacterium]|nr:MAG: hypothetical protein CM1200mP14_08110 [Gammaproteobacteria bacterium]
MTEAFPGARPHLRPLSWPKKMTIRIASCDAGKTTDNVIEDVYFQYEEDKPVLKGITFSATPGTVIALLEALVLEKRLGWIGRDIS